VTFTIHTSALIFTSNRIHKVMATEMKECV
jgi:hypothetical protein